MQSIAILTSDIMGPIANGGIGTAFYYLARLLAPHHQVTILLFPESSVSPQMLKKWQKFYAQFQIRLEAPEISPRLEIVGTSEARRSYSAYLSLKERNFDIVHFPDYLGLAYYALNSKKAGLHFQNTLFVGHLHGNTMWHLHGSGLVATDRMHFERQFLEQESILNADILVSPSAYMLEWARSQGWVQEQKTFVIPHAPIPDLPGRNLESSKIDTITFIGRLEDRKGIRQFLEACDQLPETLKIDVLGKHGEIASLPSAEFLRQLAFEKKIKLRIETQLGHMDILSYLAKTNCMVVAPSQRENLPCVVYECSAMGVPVLWTDLGGTKELFDNPANEFCIDGSANSIVQAILKNLDLLNPMPIPLSPHIRDSSQRWLELHLAVPQLMANSRPVPENELKSISVIIPTRNRSSSLDQCLASFSRQTYQDFEVIVADDGSSPTEQEQNHQVLEQYQSTMKVRYLFGHFGGPAKARNMAASAAVHDHLFFFDDDNLAQPEMLQVLARAKSHLKSIDIITFAYRMKDSSSPTTHERRWVPLGASLPLGPFGNIFGDTASLVKKSCFLEIGGFRTELFKDEDWEFHWRAVRQQKKLFALPDCLFIYNIHGGNRSLQSPRTESPFYEPTTHFFSELPPAVLPMVQAYVGKNVQSHLAVSISQKERLLNPQSDIFDIERPKAIFSNDLSFLPIQDDIYIQARTGDPYLFFRTSGRQAQKAFLHFQIFSTEAKELQVYFRPKNTTDAPDASDFEEKDVIHHRIPEGWSKVEIDISLYLLDKFRIDFGSHSGEYILREIKTISTIPMTSDFAEGWHLSAIPGSALHPHDTPTVLPKEAQLVNLEMRPQAGGFAPLEMISQSDDPQIIFSSDPDARQLFSIIDISIEVPEASEMQIFANTVDTLNFDLASVLTAPLQPGVNHMRAFFYSAKRVRQWRIDPTNRPTCFKITKLRFLNSVEALADI
jgi:O-antigen biosynthesis protein